MACIILENRSGDRRLVKSGEPYRLNPGEVIAGIDETCGGQIVPVKRTTVVATLAQELAHEVGAGFGDWIKVIASPIADVMGKKGCTACEARRIITNAYGTLKAKHGQLKALSMIKDLWALSMRAEGDQVLMRLKELLHD